MELEQHGRKFCSWWVHNIERPATARRPLLSVVNKLDNRRVLFATRSTYRGKKIFMSSVCDNVKEENTLIL